MPCLRLSSLHLGSLHTEIHFYDKREKQTHDNFITFFMINLVYRQLKHDFTHRIIGETQRTINRFPSAAPTPSEKKRKMKRKKIRNSSGLDLLFLFFSQNLKHMQSAQE